MSEPKTDSVAPAPLWEARYAMIDGWRALAALGVVFSHLGFNPGVDLGHICVLIFFVISGYGIAASAGSCKRNNVSGLGCMHRRFRRIYPPYFFSVLLFIGTRLLKDYLTGEKQLVMDATNWIQNFTLTQWLTLITHLRSMPFENPDLWVAGYWSLNYEEQFYLLIGFIMLVSCWFNKSALFAIMGLIVPAFVWNLFFPSTSFGFFLEYWISFAVGCVVFFRLCKVTSPLIRRLLDGFLVALLIFSVVMLQLHPQQGRSVYFEWIVGSGLALLLFVLRGADVPYRKTILAIIMGELSLGSYSLYLTHQMNNASSAYVAHKLEAFGMPVMFEFWVRVLVMCGFAAVFWFFCERPFVNRPLSPTAPHGFKLGEALRNWRRKGEAT